MDGALSKAERRELLERARAAIESAVGTPSRDIAKGSSGTSAVLETDGAAFVTLRKHGQLRGCIGQVEARGPLGAAVEAMAVAAATRDPRFSPVTVEEIPELTVEISVLTTPEPLGHWSDAVVGTDGLIVEGVSLGAPRRAVFLPEVAEAQGWDLPTMLSQLCRKAGLQATAYLSGDVRLLRFRSIHFGDARS
ncbi:MAG: AmmeMemoRadiSam system protein A [Myxococcota bacterium]